MENLNGKSIIQLDDFASGDKPSSGDSFFTSQQILPKAVFKEYQSKSLPYDTLIEKLFSDLSAAFGFKSMAYEPFDAYSSASHSHPYNTFDISSEYSAEDNNIPIVTFKIGTKTVRLYMPRPYVYAKPEPEIGEIKFKMLPNIANPADIDINAQDFDGWVYPAGQTYMVGQNDFQGAIDATSFTVPDFRSYSFVKAVPERGKTAITADFKNEGVPAHPHTAVIELSGGASEMEISALVTNYAGDGNAIHRGKAPYNPARQYEGTMSFYVTELNIEDVRMEDSSDALDREQYPAYNDLPVMIYIKKKYQ